MRNRKLTGHWAGFSFQGGALVTPEGRRLLPEHMAWIGLTAAMADEYRRLIDMEKRSSVRSLRVDAEPCPVIPLVPALRRHARG